MIGRLVQQEQIWPAQQQGGQTQACLLSSRKSSEAAITGQATDM